jgi:hypothetical protein
MPPFGAFAEPISYYSVLSHETTHYADTGIMPRAVFRVEARAQEAAMPFGIILDPQVVLLSLLQLILKEPCPMTTSKTRSQSVTTHDPLRTREPSRKATSAGTARERLKRDYEEYLRRQRGLSDRTILDKWQIADRFLAFRFGQEIGELSAISAVDIAAFLQHVTGRAERFSLAKLSRSCGPEVLRLALFCNREFIPMGHRIKAT